MAHTVLIIGAEPVHRDLLIHCLENRLGYQVICAANCQDAARYFYTDLSPRPDLILIDWQGEQSAATMENLKILAIHAPVVSLVKYGDYESAIKALGCGAKDFLTKPVAMERLSITFRNLLMLHEALREIERLRSESKQNIGLLPVPSQEYRMAYSLAQNFSLTDQDGNIRRIQEIEGEAIRFAMQFYHGRMTEVAKRLGIGRSTLYRKLSELSTRQHEEA